MSRIHSTVLENGIKIITEEMPDVESSSIGIWVSTGSRKEPPAKNGITHFIEHLLFKGTERRTALDIAREIESVGGVLNAFTSREYTCFYAKVINKDLPLAIDILTDILLNSRFDPSEIEKERMVVLQEIKMVEDTPDDLIHDLFTERFWNSHPLGRPVLGSTEVISSIKRGDILRYFRAHYHSNTVFVTAAGGFKHREVAKLLASSIHRMASRWQGRPSRKTPLPRPGVRLIKRTLEQVHLCMGVPVPPQPHPDRYKVYLLNTILGGGMSSRLFQEIREKRGLVYSVYSYLNLYTDAGSLVAYAGTSAENFGNVVGFILDEFQRLGSDMTEEELRNAKEQLKGGILLGLETSDNRMTRLARDEIYFGKVMKIRDIIRGIERVRLDDVRGLASMVLKPENLTLVAMGNIKRSMLPGFIRNNAEIC